MSMRNLVRELTSISSARSVLSTQYNSTRATTENDTGETLCGDHLSTVSFSSSSTDSSDASSCFPNCNKFVSNAGGGDIPSAQNLSCILTPRRMASSKSIMPRDIFLNLKNAGTRIFTAAMILCYRRQREQIKKLNAENDDLRRKCWKYDQQAFVYQKLYDDEKEQNYVLQNKLRASKAQAALTRDKRDKLMQSVKSLKAANELLEKQLRAQEEQYEGLQISFEEVQSSLFQSMARERELQKQLSEEQRRIRTLTAKENDLVLQLRDFKQIAEDKKKNLWNQLKCKQAALARYKQEKEALSLALHGLLIKKTEFDFMGTELQNSINEISQIKHNLQSLRQRLEDSWDNRIRRIWRESSGLRSRIADIVLFFGHCILPSVHFTRSSICAKMPLCS